MDIVVWELVVDFACLRGAHEAAGDDEGRAEVLVLEAAPRARSIARYIQALPSLLRDIKHAYVVVELTRRLVLASKKKHVRANDVSTVASS
ncbi:unnamed protein product [Phytophthora fragariaefolia]|uniref:Unnamed protein product n=1 Tax=Phytophthora fragariaefolia TaxID=1490495 RepID=A0A9W6WNV5_9STRA|nr:unnamed protein product [Phytophthora fragariaefolia]